MHDKASARTFYNKKILAKPLSLNIETDIMKSIDMFANKRIPLSGRTIRRIFSEKKVKIINYLLCLFIIISMKKISRKKITEIGDKIGHKTTHA